MSVPAHGTMLDVLAGPYRLPGGDGGGTGPRTCAAFKERLPFRFSETEILLPYGGCCFSSIVGQLAGNHFLTIVEGAEQLRELGRMTLREGAQPIVFEVTT